MTEDREARLRTLLLARIAEAHAVAAGKLSTLKEHLNEPLDIEEEASLLHAAHVEATLAEMTSETEQNLRGALDRLDAGTYGICTDCGEEIAEKRLEALPFAATCIGCRTRAEAPSLSRRYDAVYYA